MKVYLAGPEVFSKNARELGKIKSDLSRDYGFTPLFPLDNEVEVSGNKKSTALAIKKANRELMLEADIIIANLSPFRGPSADAGTLYEVGFMEGMGKPVFAYSNDPSNLFERTQKDFGSDTHGLDADGLLIEDFDQPENLMLTPFPDEGVFVVSDVKRELFDLEVFKSTLKIAAEKLFEGPAPI